MIRRCHWQRPNRCNMVYDLGIGSTGRWRSFAAPPRHSRRWLPCWLPTTVSLSGKATPEWASEDGAADLARLSADVRCRTVRVTAIVTQLVTQDA